MAHLLDKKSDGKAAMMYCGAVPWHGLGTSRPNPATSQEAMPDIEAEWPVEVVEAYAKVGDEKYVRIDNAFATVRRDRDYPLGVVGKRYRPIQNKRAFEFFDSVVGEGQAVYETAGVLDSGRAIWMLAKLPQKAVITSNDVVEKYLLLCNRHDGTASLRMFFTPVRVVCNNTLTAALWRKKDISEGICIRHTGEIRHKLDEARKVLGIAAAYYDALEETGRLMARAKLGHDGMSIDKAFNEYLVQVFPAKDDGSVSTILHNRRQTVQEIFENAPECNLEESRHSVWAAYNSVTQYVDHVKKVNKQDKDPEARMNSLVWGTGAKLKARAWDVAHELLLSDK